MTYYFKENFDGGMNEVLSWFGINLMVCFKILHKTIFAKISLPTDIEFFYFNL